jgi:hypothetical protein
MPRPIPSDKTSKRRTARRPFFFAESTLSEVVKLKRHLDVFVRALDRVDPVWEIGAIVPNRRVRCSIDAGTSPQFEALCARIGVVAEQDLPLEAPIQIGIVACTAAASSRSRCAAAVHVQKHESLGSVPILAPGTGSRFKHPRCGRTE